MPLHTSTETRSRNAPERFGQLVPQSETEDDDVIAGSDGPARSGKKRNATNTVKDEEDDYRPVDDILAVNHIELDRRSPKRPTTDTNIEEAEVRATQGRRKKQKLLQDDTLKAKGCLHPLNASKSFYMKQATAHRKEIKLLEQQIKQRDSMITAKQQNIREMQVRVSSIEEALLDRTKTRTDVQLDTGGVREIFEELSIMCKDWAMTYKCSGTPEENLTASDSKVVYATLRGKRENLRRQLISSEGRTLLWNHQHGIYFLLHAAIYHFACTTVLEDWLFFMKGYGQSRGLSGNAIALARIFEEARHEDENMANEWRALSIKMLKSLTSKSITGVSALQPNEAQTLKEQYYESAAWRLLQNAVVQPLLQDTECAGTVQCQRELVAIFRKAGTVALQLWSQGFIVETCGTSEADFARVFQVDDATRRPHSIMRLRDKDTSMDGTNICLVLEPSFLGKWIVHECVDQKPTVYSKSLVLALKPAEQAITPQATTAVDHDRISTPGPSYVPPVSPITPRGQEEYIDPYQTKANQFHQDLPTLDDTAKNLPRTSSSTYTNVPHEVVALSKVDEKPQEHPWSNMEAEEQTSGAGTNDTMIAQSPLVSTTDVGGNPMNHCQPHIANDKIADDSNQLTALVYANQNSAKEDIQTTTEAHTGNQHGAPQEFWDEVHESAAQVS